MNLIKRGSKQERTALLAIVGFTVERIADRMGTYIRNTQVTINCLKRDHGIDHIHLPDGRVQLIPPPGMTLADCFE